MSRLIPANYLKRMTAEDRRLYAKGQLTTEEALDKFCRADEKKLHKNFEATLRRHDLEYTHARMDKPTTIEVGTLDFHVWKDGYLHCFVEFKTEQGILSPAQQKFLARQEAKGVPCLVTCSYREALEFIVRIFGLHLLLQLPV